MLRDKDAAATIAVSDLDRAREFYENTLGLSAIYEDAGGILYRSGNSAILVYPSEYAGSNKATAVTWGVGDDFDALVIELGEAGTTFEHYDLPDTTREGDIHVHGRHEGRLVQGSRREHPEPSDHAARDRRRNWMTRQAGAATYASSRQRARHSGASQASET